MLSQAPRRKYLCGKSTFTCTQRGKSTPVFVRSPLGQPAPARSLQDTPQSKTHHSNSPGSLISSKDNLQQTNPAVGSFHVWL